MKVYLASPLGFSEAGRMGLRLIKEKLEWIGHTVLDPWDSDFSQPISIVTDPENTYEQTLRTAMNLAMRIGFHNISLIDEADCVFAVLDGQEPDSGTVSELAYAVGKGKLVMGYRGDFRNLGELPGVPVNLQVYTFLRYGGGKLFRSIEEIDF